MTERLTNAQIEDLLATKAECDVRTARKALERGVMSVRAGSTRDRIDSAMRRMPDVVKQYSKEHYP